MKPGAEGMPSRQAKFYLNYSRPRTQRCSVSICDCRNCIVTSGTYEAKIMHEETVKPILSYYKVAKAPVLRRSFT